MVYMEDVIFATLDALHSAEYSVLQSCSEGIYFLHVNCLYVFPRCGINGSGENRGQSYSLTK